MASKRPRTRGGGPSSSSAKLKKEKTTPDHPFLDFSSQAQKERYAYLRKLLIIFNRYIDYNELAILGLKVEVKQMVDETRLDYFVSIWEPTVRELFLEFLTTFQFFKMLRIDYD